MHHQVEKLSIKADALSSIPVSHRARKELNTAICPLPSTSALVHTAPLITAP